MTEFNYKDPRWMKKRAAILARDGYKCRRCRRYGRNREAQEVHHILHADQHPELAFEDSNLISLCGACHRKQHPEKVYAATYGRPPRY